MGANDHVSKLSGRAALTAIDLAIEDDSGAHAFGREHEYEVARVTHFRTPKPQLCQRYSVRVIICRHRQAGR